MDAQTQDKIEAARLFAKAEKSDPFAFSRAMTHIDNGIVGIFLDDNGNIKEALYSAERHIESRKLPNKQIKGIEWEKFTHGGDSYDVTTYRNLVRP